jgi:hypothetical protein
MRLIHAKIRVSNKYAAKGQRPKGQRPKRRMLEVYMDRKKDNLDIRVLTREYSSELARAEAVRQYLEEVRRDGVQNDKADGQRHIGGKRKESRI